MYNLLIFFLFFFYFDICFELINKKQKNKMIFDFSIPTLLLLYIVSKTEMNYEIVKLTLVHNYKDENCYLLKIIMHKEEGSLIGSM